MLGEDKGRAPRGQRAQAIFPARAASGGVQLQPGPGVRRCTGLDEVLQLGPGLLPPDSQVLDDVKKKLSSGTARPAKKSEKPVRKAKKK